MKTFVFCILFACCLSSVNAEQLNITCSKQIKEKAVTYDNSGKKVVDQTDSWSPGTYIKFNLDVETTSVSAEWKLNNGSIASGNGGIVSTTETTIMWVVKFSGGGVDSLWTYTWPINTKTVVMTGQMPIPQMNILTTRSLATTCNFTAN